MSVASVTSMDSRIAPGPPERTTAITVSTTSSTEQQPASAPPRGGPARGGGGGGMGMPGPARIDPADRAQLAESPVEARRLLALFTPHRWSLIIVTAMIVATSVAGLANPFLLRGIIDQALPHQNVRLLLILVAAMVAIAVVT